MARVGGQLDGNLLVVARAVHALLAEVVLDVTAALDRALRYIALELAEQLVEVLAGDVHQHVQAAAVGHAHDRLVHADGRGPLEHGVEDDDGRLAALEAERSEEHTSELQSLMRISYAVFCLKK